MIIGYINAHNLSDYKNQKQMLQDFNCDTIASESINGFVNKEALNRFIKSDHSLVHEIFVCSISVIPFTAYQTMQFIVDLESQGIRFKSIHDPFLCLDTMESLLYLKRRRSYITCHFRHKVSKGRPKKILTEKERKELQNVADLYVKRTDLSIDEIMRISGFKHRSTFYRKLASIGVFPQTEKGRLREHAYLKADSNKHEPSPEKK